MSFDTRLAEFLASDSRPESTMIYPELHGYIFAIACSPVAPDFDEWFSLIFNDEAPNYASDEEAAWVQQTVMFIYADTKQRIANGEIMLPEWCQVLTPPMSNFEEDSPLAHWSRGLVEGHHWLNEVWKTYLSAKLDSELSACLMVLSFFSEINLAQAYCEEYAHAFSHTVDEMAETVADTFEHAMMGYAKIGYKVYLELKKLDNQAGLNQVAREALCPCGSGKPFKVCCLH